MAAASSSVPCGSCVLCCRKQRVFMARDDDAVSLRAVPEYNSATGKMGMRLPRKLNGDCAYLGDQGCTIYDRRPTVCRLYDCREHSKLPSAERRSREAKFSPHDIEIVRHGRALAERSR